MNCAIKMKAVGISGGDEGDKVWRGMRRIEEERNKSKGHLICTCENVMMALFIC